MLGRSFLHRGQNQALVPDRDSFPRNSFKEESIESLTGSDTMSQLSSHVDEVRHVSQEIVTRVVLRNTALAGEYLGKKLIYLEAGSGARVPVDAKIITQVKTNLTIPLIVGGGINSKKQLKDTYSAGADMVVIGTAFEKNEVFFKEIKKKF